MAISEYSSPNATVIPTDPASPSFPAIALDVEALGKNPGEEFATLKLFADLKADLSSPLDEGKTASADGLGSFTALEVTRITNEGENVAVILAQQTPKTLPVTIHRPGGPLLDAGGQPVYDDYGQPQMNPPQDIPVEAWSIAPERSLELVDGRQTLVVTLVGIFPPGASVKSTDELTALGKRYRVTGVYPVPLSADPGKVHHVRADLQEAS